ncbi:hypothetical protein LLG95_06600 [bacterium]|nr:hypothetical protein [bacterium]
MDNETKFRVQAGNLLFEIEGSQDFVQKQMEEHRERIQTILAEQVRLIKSGKISGRGRGRRGRPPKAGRRGPKQPGQRPGRQPVIVRESSLELKPRQLSGLRKFVEQLAGGGKLGKDATVFTIAYYLCNEIFKADTFTAGDVMMAYQQLGSTAGAPAPDSVDVVQMLRNLAATSIGKEWVARNADGTFSLTQKGKDAGGSGNIIRPRGRRPAAEKSAAAEPKKRGRKPGRSAGVKRGPGRPPKVASRRGPGRPPKNR